MDILVSKNSHALKFEGWHYNSKQIVIKFAKTKQIFDMPCNLIRQDLKHSNLSSYSDKSNIHNILNHVVLSIQTTQGYI